MKAPFPYFGGKRDVAAEVWRRFGRPKQYIEPFCGSAAILLGSDRPCSLEVIGDFNGFVANCCFASALATVRKWGGVLEHPAGSHAWAAFGLVVPSRGGYWTADFFGGHTIEVEQGHYGHLARKKTWLYAFAPWRDLPILARGPSSASMRLDEGFHSAEERCAARAAGIPPRKRLSRVDNLSTPPAFRDVLIGIARSARRSEAA